MLPPFDELVQARWERTEAVQMQEWKPKSKVTEPRLQGRSTYVLYASIVVAREAFTWRKKGGHGLTRVIAGHERTIIFAVR